MKKQLLLGLFCGLLSIACFAEENLILNHSFEQVVDGLPLRWAVNRPANLTPVEFKAEETDCPDGKFCGTIISGDPATAAGHYVAWIFGIPLHRAEKFIPEKEMVLRFSYRTDSSATCLRAYVEGRADKGGFCHMGNAVHGKTAWSTYEFRFRMPREKPAMMYLVLQLLNKGSVSFDNVKLTEVKK